MILQVVSVFMCTEKYNWILSVRTFLASTSISSKFVPAWPSKCPLLARMAMNGPASVWCICWCLLTNICRRKPAWKVWGCESCLICVHFIACYSFFFTVIAFLLAGPHWASLVLVGSYWSLLVFTGPFLSLLVPTGSYWSLLALTGPSWSLPVLIELLKCLFCICLKNKQTN